MQLLSIYLFNDHSYTFKLNSLVTSSFMKSLAIQLPGSQTTKELYRQYLQSKSWFWGCRWTQVKTILTLVWPSVKPSLISSSSYFLQNKFSLQFSDSSVAVFFCLKYWHSRMTNVLIIVCFPGATEANVIVILPLPKRKLIKNVLAVDGYWKMPAWNHEEAHVSCVLEIFTW